MKPIRASGTWREGALALVSLLALVHLSPVAASLSTQHILSNPSNDAVQCIPTELIHEYLEEKLAENHYTEEKLEELRTDPNRIDPEQICYTRDPVFRLTVKVAHRNRSFDILIQDGPVPGFDRKYLDDDLVAYINDELEADEALLEDYLDSEDSGEEPDEEILAGLYATSLELVLESIKSCDSLVRELALNNQGDQAAGVEDVKDSNPTTLRIIDQTAMPPSCIWPGAPDFDARITRHRERSCEDCLDRSFKFPHRDPDEAKAEFEQMAQLTVSVEARPKSPSIVNEEGFRHSLEAASVVHKYATFPVNLESSLSNRGDLPIADELISNWNQRIDEACMWDDDEMPETMEIEGKDGKIEYYAPPCKYPKVVEDIQSEILTLCGAAVRDAMINVPNNGFVVDRGSKGQSLDILRQEDGEPTCILADPPPKSEEDQCPFGCRFDPILEQIQADEQTKAALQDIPIVPGNTVLLDLQPSVLTVKVNDTEYQMRHVSPGSDKASISDLMSMLRIAQWSKSNPENAAVLHVLPLKGIIVDSQGCYLGMLLESRGVQPGFSRASCLYQCTYKQKAEWLHSLNQDMDFLRNAQLDPSIVDNARVSIDRNDQVWILDFLRHRGSGVDNELSSNHAHMFVRKLTKDLRWESFKMRPDYVEGIPKFPENLTEYMGDEMDADEDVDDLGDFDDDDDDEWDEFLDNDLYGEMYDSLDDEEDSQVDDEASNDADNQANHQFNYESNDNTNRKERHDRESGKDATQEPKSENPSSMAAQDSESLFAGDFQPSFDN